MPRTCLLLLSLVAAGAPGPAATATAEDPVSPVVVTIYTDYV